MGVALAVWFLGWRLALGVGFGVLGSFSIGAGAMMVVRCGLWRFCWILFSRF